MAFALGVMFWLFERSMDPTLSWIEEKFGKRPIIAEANRLALQAGYAFGETTEIFHTRYVVPAAHLAPGTYRNLTGNEGTALGFVVAGRTKASVPTRVVFWRSPFGLAGQPNAAVPTCSVF